MSQTHSNHHSITSVTHGFTNHDTNDVMNKKSSSSSQSNVLQSETQESSNYELVHDTVIQKYLDSSSQDIIFSQDSQAATKKYLLEETEPTSSQYYDSIVSSSQQVTIDDTIPPPLSQDSFMKNYYPASQEIVVEEQPSYRNPIASSIPEDNPDNESDDYNEKDDDDDDNEEFKNHSEHNNGGFGVLSQGDHVIMSMGGEIRNVFGSESKLTQELPLSQLTADGPTLSRCQSHTILDDQTNNHTMSDEEYGLKITRSTDSTSVDRERLRMELSYSNTCSNSVKNGGSNNDTKTSSCSNTISFCESAASSVVSDQQQQQHQHNLMTSNLGSLLQAVHLKEQEQELQEQQQHQSSVAAIDRKGKYQRRRSKIQREKIPSSSISMLPPKIHKNTIFDYSKNGNNGIQDTVNILKPGGASKKRHRSGGDVGTTTILPDGYVSVGLTEPYAKRVSPSTPDSTYSTVGSAQPLKTPPRRTIRSGSKLTTTGITDISPMIIQSPIPEDTIYQPKKTTPRKSKQQPKTRKNAKNKEVEDTFLDDIDDDENGGGENTADHLQIAQEAAALAARALKDQGLASRLLLSLILTREKPGGSNRIQIEQLTSTRADANAATADNPFYMPVGFQWCEFPPLEDLLKKNRKKYYELSMNPTLRQTVEQLSFNNQLVSLVRQISIKYHWIFYNRKSDKTESQDSSNSERYNWTDKALRDRIRFYYKTNLQNARGRLHTMLKNPSKRSNARNLNALYRLLQESTTSSTSPAVPSPPPTSSTSRRGSQITYKNS